MAILRPQVSYRVMTLCTTHTHSPLCQPPKHGSCRYNVLCSLPRRLFLSCSSLVLSYGRVRSLRMYIVCRSLSEEAVGKATLLGKNRPFPSQSCLTRSPLAMKCDPKKQLASIYPQIDLRVSKRGGGCRIYIILRTPIFVHLRTC